MKFSILLVSALLAHANASQITPGLTKELADGPTDIIIRFASTTPTLDSLNSIQYRIRTDRVQAVHDSLVAFANQSQKNVIAFLQSKSIEYSQFWISNDLFVKNVDADIVAKLADFPEIVNIRENRRFELEKPEQGTSIKRNNILAEWGIENIRAHMVWTMPGGGNGNGVIVSTIDTGARYTHEALRANFYGTYGWYDPYTRSPTPIDTNGHGTHTMGTICGSGGIGVAPGATWQACRGCDTSSCSDSALISCGQFIACPHLPDGTQPNCTHAPHICSNSWGGGQADPWYDAVINAWHQASIIPVFANGNSGSSCGSANSPADSQASVIGVGSTTSSNALSSFSSRGPSEYNDIKPDISAPGSDVRSSYHTSDTAYSSLSGTSMACPHVAGVIALLHGINDTLLYSDYSRAIFRTASTNLTPTGQNCGGIVDSVYPNHSFGYGKVDAYGAAQDVLDNN